MCIYVRTWPPDVLAQIWNWSFLCTLYHQFLWFGNWRTTGLPHPMCPPGQTSPNISPLGTDLTVTIFLAVFSSNRWPSMQTCVPEWRNVLLAGAESCCFLLLLVVWYFLLVVWWLLTGLLLQPCPGCIFLKTTCWCEAPLLWQVVFVTLCVCCLWDNMLWYIFLN